jgi:hypothetical protein
VLTVGADRRAIAAVIVVVAGIDTLRITEQIRRLARGLADAADAARAAARSIAATAVGRIGLEIDAGLAAADGAFLARRLLLFLGLPLPRRSECRAQAEGGQEAAGVPAGHAAAKLDRQAIEAVIVHANSPRSRRRCRSRWCRRRSRLSAGK